MALVRSTNRSWKYVLVKDRDQKGEPKPGASTFTLHSLKAWQQDAVTDMGGVGAGGEIRVALGRSSAQMLRWCLSGWENFDAPFKPGAGDERCAQESLEYLTSEDRIELASEVWEKSNLTAAQGN